MKKYTRPEIEISVFATEDIITASSADDNTTVTLSLKNGVALTNSTTDGVDYDTIGWGQ